MSKKIYISQQRRRIVIMSIIGFTIIGLFIVGGVFILNNLITLQKNNDSSQIKPGTTVPDYYERALRATKVSGIEAGQAVIDKEIAKTSIPQQKAQLYSAKAKLAVSDEITKDYEAAADYSIKSYELDSTSDSAGLAAFYFEQAGSKADAIKYYQLAIDKIGDYDKADSMVQSEYIYYQSKIEILQSS